MATPDTKVPPRIGGYRLLARLGSGATADVYLAESDLGETPFATPTRVALKAFRTGRDVSAMEAEATLGGRLSDDGIPRTLDSGVDASEGRFTPYLVSEYADGRTLHDLILESGPMPEPFVRAIGAQLARAVASLHGAGVLHRDIKPSNVVISPNGRLRLLDLGAAMALGDAPATPRHFVGTPAHSAPEQLLREPLAPAADLYAIGSTLHVALTGAAPFGDGSLDCLRAAKCSEAPGVARGRPTVSRLLEAIVDTLLARLPADRSFSASQLAETLERGESSDWWHHRVRREVGHLRHPSAFSETFLVPLVGRTQELEVLLAAVDGTQAGSGASFVLTGEPGAGKSRVGFEVLARVPASGRRLVTRLDGAGESPGSLRTGSGLARIRWRAKDACRGRAPSQEELAFAAAAEADELCADGPAAWMLDDIGDAEPGDVAILNALVHASCRLPLVVMLVAAASPPGWLDGRAKVIRIEPLSPPQAEELARAAGSRLHGSESHVQEVVAQAGGLPTLVIELMRGLSPPSGWAPGESTSCVLADVLDRRIPSESADSRGVLEALAVAGGRVQARELAGVLKRPVLSVLADLAELEHSRGLIRSAADQVDVSSLALRTHVLGAMGTDRRHALHAAWGNNLAAMAMEGGAPDPGLAQRATWHLLRCPDAPIPEDVLRAAFDGATLALDWSLAMDICERLLERAQVLSLDVECAARFRRAQLLMAIGRSEDPKLLAELVERAGRAGRLDLAAEACVEAGFAWLGSQSVDESLTSFAEGARLAVTAGRAEVHARALFGIGSVHTRRIDIPAARDAYAAAVDVGDREGLDSALVSKMRARLSYALARVGDSDRALDLARSVVKDIGEPQTWGDYQMLERVSTTLLYLGRHADAVLLMERVVGGARKMGLRAGVMRPIGVLARLRYFAGDLRGARLAAEEAVEAAREASGDGIERIHALRLVASLALEEGRIEAALEASRDALERVRDMRLDGEIATTLYLRGEVHQAFDRHELALDSFRRAQDAAARVSNTEVAALGSIGAATCWIALGRADLAHASLREAAKLADRHRVTIGWLPEAYAFLLGKGPLHAVRIADSTSSAIRAETALVLAEATRDSRRIGRAQELVAALAQHLTPTERERFWRCSLLGRRMMRLLGHELSPPCEPATTTDDSPE